MKRIGVIGIIVKADEFNAQAVQRLLSEYACLITGRMGVPDTESGVNAIAVIVKGENEEISALAGKLGKLGGVYVKSALTALELA